MLDDLKAALGSYGVQLVEGEESKWLRAYIRGEFRIVEFYLSNAGICTLTFDMKERTYGDGDVRFTPSYMSAPCANFEQVLRVTWDIVTWIKYGRRK